MRQMTTNDALPPVVKGAKACWEVVCHPASHGKWETLRSPQGATVRRCRGRRDTLNVVRRILQMAAAAFALNTRAKALQPALLMSLVACGTPRSKPPAAPVALQSAEGCLNWESYPEGNTWGPGRHLVGEVTSDRGQPYGVRVVLMREGRIVGTAVTQPKDQNADGDVGRYSFPRLVPGAYDLVFKYGNNVVAREHLEITDTPITSWKTALHLSNYRQIPACA